MNCEECDEEIEGKPIEFRNQKFCLACAKVMQEDLENAINDSQEED